MENEANKSAIVLIEFQKQWTEKGFLHKRIKRELESRSVLDNTQNLVFESRSAGIQIIHAPLIINPKKKKGWYARVTFGKFFTKDTWKSEMTPGIYQKGDIIVKGRYAFDAFIGSDLEENLIKHQITNLYLCGFITDQCISLTMKTALKKGFKATMITDCTATLNKKMQKKTENKFPNQNLISMDFILSL